MPGQRPRDDTVNPLRLRSRDRVRHERPDTALDAPLLLKERRTLLRPESQIRGQNLVHRGGQNVTVHARRQSPHRPLQVTLQRRHHHPVRLNRRPQRHH